MSSTPPPLPASRTASTSSPNSTSLSTTQNNNNNNNNNFIPHIRTAEAYKREMMGFGIEVLKYPRTGKPGLRIMILSLEPLELYYVGKSGKRKSIDLKKIISMKRGSYNPNSPQSGSFASPVFNIAPDSITRAHLQFSFELDDDDSRDNLDIEIDHPSHADFFEAVMEGLLTHLAKKAPSSNR